MTRPMKKRMNKLLGNVVVPAVAGLLAVIELAGSPRFHAFRIVDVVQLVASGMCFGVALSAFFSIVRPSQTMD